MPVSDLPTPEELGEKLKAGEITKEEAIEVMSERARMEAFSNMYGGAQGENGGKGGDPSGTGKAGLLVGGGIILLIILLLILTQFL